jgi:hypothetical protein
MRCIVWQLSIVLIAPILIAATPAPGSAQRAQIMDALRPGFAHQLGGPVKFVVKRLQVQGDFAYVEVQPRHQDGSAYRIQRPGWMDAYGGAVLQNKNGAWRVLDARLGPTDVWYCGYSSRFAGGLPYC